ncbi:MAG: hypothetical protein A2Y63_06390 [Candidatus Riflebacteria bacterium RBG_13_59_9]|nr:MAG: hypothetical protein A2Y63_06390 [Candidatus Riflebacteria bacterium RBG_13_59_9]
MKSSDNRVFKVLLGILLAVIVFTAYTLGQASVARGSEGMLGFLIGTDTDASKLPLVGTALKIVKSRYFMPIEDDEQLVYGALEGMVNALHRSPYDDPYSGFLDVSSWDTLKATTEGGYAGIGILIGPSVEHPFPVVVTVFPDSPAGKAGLRENDLIVEVGGVSTQDMLVDEVAVLIKGEMGTEVTLLILRENLLEPIEFTAKREAIELHTVTEHRVLDDGSGYLRLAMFGETTPSEVEKVLAEFAESNVDGLIIDLRNNVGGLLQGAVGVADLFVKEGTIVSVESRTAPTEVHSADPARRKYEFSLVLLVNQQTASAAEVLAGALRDHGLAVLIGEKTFGKGVVQEVTELDQGRSALALTIGRYLTPLGHDLGGTGLEPDVTVGFDDYKARDPELVRLGKKLDSKREEIQEIGDQIIRHLVANDYQLRAGQEIMAEKLAGDSREDAA